MPVREVSRSEVAAAIVRTWAELTRHAEGAWSRRDGNAAVVVSGLPVPTMNGAWTWSLDATPDEMDRHVSEVRGAGVPFSLMVPVEAAENYQTVVARHGLAYAADVPLMVLADVMAVRSPPPPPGLTVRQLGVSELAAHADLAGRVFGLPAAVFERLTSPAMAQAGSSRFYLGEVDGQPVTTGLGVTLGHSVAVFNIATAEDHRGRGYGADITARIVLDGSRAGAKWAWLQSSTAGLGIYRSLGFDVADTWRCWIRR